MQPLNLIKNYYGEKFAFEYAFLIHYSAWLTIPACMGILLWFYQLDRFRKSGDFKESLDSPMNGMFGLLTAIWAILFTESWKRKQKAIQYLWGCSDGSFSAQDEREDDFKFYEIFNPSTVKKEKQKLEMTKKRKCMLTTASYTFLFIVLAAMAIYQQMILTTKGERDEDGNIIAEPTDYDKTKGTVLTAIYSAIVILFGTLYKLLAKQQTEEENHKYWKQYDDALVKRLFLFNGLNFYFPLIFVAFDPRNASNYDDLFSLLMSQLAYK